MSERHRINTNALVGYRCPACGCGDNISFITTCFMPWADDGTDFASSPEIVDDDGMATCGECGHNGATKEFDLRAAYIGADGMHCPYCLAGPKELTTLEPAGVVDAGKVMERSACMRCGGTWQTTYGITELTLDEDFIKDFNERAEAGEGFDDE